MTKRTIVLAVVAAALAVPALSLADGGGNSTSTTAAATHDGSRIIARLDRLQRRLDRHFAAFSSRCLVANAPKGCARVANRAVRRMDRAQAALTRLENAVKTTCAAASPPGPCANAGTITSKIDALLSSLGSDEAAIKAAYPNAGSGAAAAPA
jgi:hypothetical protein